jgi:hypothetical protein
MVDFDKFEKLVKQKYGEQEFEFDEANWNKARQMIDASRKDKNRGGFWLIASVTMMITTGLVYYFAFKGGDGINDSKIAVNETQANKELVVNSSDDQKPEENSSLNYSASKNETVTSENNNNTNNSSASSENNSQTSTAKNSSISGSDLKTASGSNTNSANHTNASSTSNTSRTNTSAKSESKNSPASSANETKSNENAVKNNTKKSETTKAGKKNNIPPVLGTNVNSNTSPRTNDNTSANSIAGNGERLGEGNNINSPNAIKTSDPIVTDSSQAIVNVSVKPVSDAVETKLTDSSEAITQLPVDSFKLPVPAVKGEGTSYATNVKLEHEYKNFLYMEAGATYLLGWNGGGHEADGFNLVAGLNFQHYFTSNISAQIGAQYSTISNLTNSTHTISTKNYDFGLQQDVTTISYSKLHYVVVPVKAAITIRKNNILGLGCNIGYLLNSESKKEKYTISNNTSNKSNLTSSKEKGYVQGFNPFDVQVSAFYKRKLYKGFGVNAEFIYGLTDVKNNDFFKTNSFDRNLGFKLTLCYELFKK